MSFDEFSDLYDEFEGFSGEYNKNSQLINNDETLFSFISEGCNALLNEDEEAVKILI